MNTGEISGDYETFFSLLYTLYAMPNIVLPFFGGFFVDNFGVRETLLAFSTLIAFGQIVIAIGVQLKSWPIIFIGRFIFGLGNNQSIYIIFILILINRW